MGKKIRAIFDGNVFCPEGHVEFEINGHYVLNIEPAKKDEDAVCNVESDSAFSLASLAVQTGIPDLATQHDHYLYGVPKQKPNDE